jgi:hypothetical protein
MAAKTFSFKRFFLGAFSGMMTVTIVVVVSVMLWGDKLLEFINKVYLGF